VACADEHGEGGEFGGEFGEGECCVLSRFDRGEGIDKFCGIVACFDFDYCIFCPQHNDHTHFFNSFSDECPCILESKLNHIPLHLCHHVLIPHDPGHPRCLSFFILKHGVDELKHHLVDQDEEASAYACEEGMSEEPERL